MKYRALTGLSWWKVAGQDPEVAATNHRIEKQAEDETHLCDDCSPRSDTYWANYAEGEVFEPLKHFKMDLALARGIAEKVGKKVTDGED